MVHACIHPKAVGEGALHRAPTNRGKRQLVTEFSPATMPVSNALSVCCALHFQFWRHHASLARCAGACNACRSPGRLEQWWSIPVQAFFTSKWQQLARCAVHNFFSEVLPQTPLPTLLQLHADRAAMQRSLADAASLRQEVARLRLQLEEAQSGGMQHEAVEENVHGHEAHKEEGVELKVLQASRDLTSHSVPLDT